LQEQASNHLKLLWSKAMVVSVKEKSRLRLWQVRIRETSEGEPLMRCRKQKGGVKTGGLSDLQDESRGNLFTAWAAPRHEGDGLARKEGLANHGYGRSEFLSVSARGREALREWLARAG